MTEGVLMREILFRGKRIDNGEWVEGDYGHEVVRGDNGGVEHLYREYEDTLHYIVVGAEPFMVDPATVGQSTGLTDANGKKIFEGDVLFDSIFEYQGIVVWNESEGALTVEFENISESLGDWHTAEVIGKIHDNPELLEVE